MASYRQPNILAFKAAAAMAAYVAVKAGADREHVAICSAKTDKSVGISMSVPEAADEVMEVALPGGGAKAKLGGSVSFGDLLAPTTDGTLIATTTAGDTYIARAMEDGVQNDVIAVEVVSGLI
jgi:hypothetical protein